MERSCFMTRYLATSATACWLSAEQHDITSVCFSRRAHPDSADTRNAETNLFVLLVLRAPCFDNELDLESKLDPNARQRNTKTVKHLRADYGILVDK